MKKRILSAVLASLMLAGTCIAADETITYDFPADAMTEDITQEDMQGIVIQNGFHNAFWLGKLSTTCTHGYLVTYKLEDLSLEGYGSASFGMVCKYINDDSCLEVTVTTEDGEVNKTTLKLNTDGYDMYTVSLPADKKVTGFEIFVNSEMPDKAMYNVELDFLKFHKGSDLMLLSIGGEAVFNGQKYTPDAPAVIKDGATLTPARFVAEKLGADVQWDAQNRKVTITKGDNIIELVIDSKTAYVNGEQKELSVPACIIDGRTFTPARFVAEALGATVGWDGQTRTVFVDLVC